MGERWNDSQEQRWIEKQQISVILKSQIQTDDYHKN